MKKNGFTLVELAIALMVIGLLIGGVLKGQELVENARLTKVIRQIGSYDTATAIFQNTYNALPGDIKTPSTRLPDCTSAPCNAAGNGNRMIEPSPTAPVFGRGNFDYEEYVYGAPERNNFWLHLSKANLITGIDSTGGASLPFQWGVQLPALPYEGAGVVCWSGNITSYNLRGNFFALLGPDTNQGALPTKAAASFDTKLDDGKPLSGDVFVLSNGASAQASCATGSGATATYSESATGGTCDLVVVQKNK